MKNEANYPHGRFVLARWEACEIYAKIPLPTRAGTEWPLQSRVWIGELVCQNSRSFLFNRPFSVLLAIAPRRRYNFQEAFGSSASLKEKCGPRAVVLALRRDRDICHRAT
jgi:hypothetical protein